VRASVDDFLGDEIQVVAVGASQVAEGQLSVLGQQVVLDEITEVVILADGSRAYGPEAVATIAQGNSITVAGEIMDAGQILATVIVVSNEQYVHGADNAYLRARISDVNPAIAVASSSSSVIDFSASLYNGSNNNFAVGDIIEVTGITNGTDANLIFAQAANIL